MNNRFKVACTLVRRFYVTSCWLDSNISNCLGSAGDSQCTERRGLESPSFFNTETSGRLTYLEMFQTTKYQFLFSSVWKPYKSLPKCRTTDFSCTHNSVLYQLTVPSFTIWTFLLLRIVPYLNFLSPSFDSPHGATLLIVVRSVDVRNVMCRMYRIAKQRTSSFISKCEFPFVTTVD